MTQEVYTVSDVDSFLPDEADVMKTLEEEAQDDLDIQVVDDRPPEDQRAPRAFNPTDEFNIDEEIEGIDKETKDHISRLKYEYHEQRRAKEEAARLRDEALTYAKQVQGQNLHLNDLVGRSEQALLSSVSTRADAEIESAKQAYKKAYDDGDTDAMVSAQESMTRAHSDKSYLQNYQPQVQQPAQQPAQPQAMQTPQLDERTQGWIAKNPWFQQPGYEAMSGFALGMHQNLASRGINATNDAYFEHINTELERAFPQFFQQETEDPASSPRRNITVVAPAQREGKQKRQVKLNKSQVDLSRRLGITPQQYAKQMRIDEAKEALL
jgi:hypothetical protein